MINKIFFSLLFVFLTTCAPVFAAHPVLSPKFRALDANGNPLSGGLLYSYQAGTTTPLATYTDQGALTENANPVVLDANGEANVWVKNDSYKFVLKNSAEVTQWTVDAVAHSWTADNLASNAVTTAKINDSAVTSAKILDGTIATADIADSAVTRAKLGDLGEEISASDSGTFSTTSATPVDITNLSVTITTTGRPVFIGLVSSVGASFAYISAASTNDTTEASIRFLRDSTTLAHFVYYAKAGGATDIEVRFGSGPWFIDVPIAGTYTYKATAYQREAATTTAVNELRLVVFEL